MGQVTLLQADLSDIELIQSQYPSAQYWDPSVKALRGQTVDSETILDALESEAGTIILAGLLDQSGLSESQKFALINISRSSLPLHLVVLYPQISVPPELYPFVRLDKMTLPDATEIRHILTSFDISNESFVQVCLGLTQGEILRLLQERKDDITLEQIQDYKLGKLRSLGVDLLPKPDVEVAGLDNLNAILDKAARMLEPDARDYGLKFPKGILLWGIPGTGKTLSAKHAATRMGIPLIALDWGKILDPMPGKSESNLRQILDIAEASSPVILYADDFDKAFSSSDLSQESSTEKRIAGMLLTWLQDNSKPVYFMASVNRAEQMPPELLRRFADIVFVDFPHQGQAKEIFDLHLKKYTNSFEATRVQWQQILREYLYCTPAEIGNAVEKVAMDAYCNGNPGRITPEALVSQRKKFVSGYTRDQAAILRIQKNARLAIPATSEDNSVWKVQSSSMFQVLNGGNHV